MVNAGRDSQYSSENLVHLTYAWVRSIMLLEHLNLWQRYRCTPLLSFIGSIAANYSRLIIWIIRSIGHRLLFRSQGVDCDWIAPSNYNFDHLNIVRPLSCFILFGCHMPSLIIAPFFHFITIIITCKLRQRSTPFAVSNLRSFGIFTISLSLIA